jgi:hypothetical protein
MKSLALALAMTAVSAGQSGAERIAGSWSAQFAGRTFVRLELKTANGTIAGGMALGNFEVDAQGEVRRASDPPQVLTPIFAATLRGSTLSFSRKDGDGTDQFELRLLEAGGADLKFLLTDADLQELAGSGIPAPKPIRLTKQ